MDVRFYYQLDSTNFVQSVITSANPPSGIRQIATNSMIVGDILKFDEATKEIIFYEYTYDEKGEVNGKVEDTTKARITIPDGDIMNATPVQQPAPNPQPASEPAPEPGHDRP